MAIVIIFYVGLIMKNVVERIWLMLMNQPFNHFNQTRGDYKHESDQNIWNHD